MTDHYTDHGNPLGSGFVLVCWLADLVLIVAAVWSLA